MGKTKAKAISFANLGDGFELEHQPGGLVAIVTGKRRERVIEWTSISEMSHDLERWLRVVRAVSARAPGDVGAVDPAMLEAELKQHATDLGARRDRLRELKDAIDDEITDADEAIEHLESAITTLSKHH